MMMMMITVVITVILLVIREGGLDFVILKRALLLAKSVSGLEGALDFLTQISQVERAPTILASKNPKKSGD